jgi:hypothetical protein
MPDPTSGGAVFGAMSGFTMIVGAGLLLTVGAGVLVAVIHLRERVSAADATELGLSVAVILVGVMSVMMFVCIFCSAIHPTERFVGGPDPSPSPGPGDTVASTTPEDTLLNGITDAEQKVCELIERSDKYIESDIGKPGQDDPSLVVAAQNKARAAVPGGRLVDCTVGAIQPTLDTADARLTLLENSLKWFTRPELDATYKKAMAGCEGFINGSNNPAPVVDLAALQARLDTINTEIADQHTTRLDPLDKQQAALKRGEVSDCQKKMGAGAGADAAAASKRPPAGTPTSD